MNLLKAAIHPINFCTSWKLLGGFILVIADTFSGLGSIPRWFDMIPQDDQVRTQVELPPYHGPHGLFNLVAVEIVSKHNLRCFTE
jgi:hypothetical protein